MATGIIGVPLGSYLSQRYNRKYPRADAYICAIGLILSAPLLAGAMLTVNVNATLAYVLIFFAELTLNLNWAIVADILLVRSHRPCDENTCIRVSGNTHILSTQRERKTH